MENNYDVHEMSKKLERFFVQNFGTNKIDNNQINVLINNTK